MNEVNTSSDPKLNMKTCT